MVRRKGYGRASGAGTIINAIATYRGAAFGIDMWTHAEVEVGEDIHGIHCEVSGIQNADTRLIERCVGEVLRKFGIKLSAFVRTSSEIPMGSGLKSSSAAANAVIVATLDAIGCDIDVLDAIRLGAIVAKEVGVSITGAFDDACASMLGGFVVTDNRQMQLLRRDEHEFIAVVLIPHERAFTAETNVLRARTIANWVEKAFDDALHGKYEEAMTLNGFLYTAALGFSAEPMLVALECGVKGVSLSGTGPSYVALVESEEKAREVEHSWNAMGWDAEVRKCKINNRCSYSSGC